MVKEIETGMAEQLERVHEWWANNQMVHKKYHLVPIRLDRCHKERKVF